MQLERVCAAFTRQDYSQVIAVFESLISTPEGRTDRFKGEWIDLACMYLISSLQAGELDNEKIVHDLYDSIVQIPIQIIFLICKLRLAKGLVKETRKTIEEYLILQDDSFYLDLSDNNLLSDSYCSLVELYLIDILCQLKDHSAAIQFLELNDILTLDTIKKLKQLINDDLEKPSSPVKTRAATAIESQIPKNLVHSEQSFIDRIAKLVKTPVLKQILKTMGPPFLLAIMVTLLRVLINKYAGEKNAFGLILTKILQTFRVAFSFF